MSNGHVIEDHQASENTPLLTSSHNDTSSIHSESITKKPLKIKWYSIVALISLIALTVVVIVAGFVIPDAVQKYAMQALELDLQNVVPELTETGAKARIQASFSLNSVKVENRNIRNIGRFGTWIARQVSSEESQLDVTLPEYDGALLGSAIIPALKVSIVDGRKTDLDFYTDLIPPRGIEKLKPLVDEWTSGKLDHVKVLGTVSLAVRSGLISLPIQKIKQIIDLNGEKIPKLPQFNITRLNFHDSTSEDSKSHGMTTEATITVKNDYPLDIWIPPLNFDIKVDNCLPNQEKILLANASVLPTHVHPYKDVTVNSSGNIFQPSDSLTSLCPGTGNSPLDTLLGGYIQGHKVELYISGASNQPSETPQWITDIIDDFTVPVPITGHSFENVIKNFTLANLNIDFPDPSAEPGTPESNPSLSGNLKAFIILPEEMNFKLDVQRVKATSDVFYKNNKLGELNIKEWQAASSNRVSEPGFDRPLLLVESQITKAPLEITDQNVFADMLQGLLFGQKIRLKVKAMVDVEVGSALGVLTVQQVPAEGEVPVKPILGNGVDTFKPIVKSLDIMDTTKDSVTIEATVDIYNPTNYSASIPFVDVYIYANNSYIGNVTANNIVITQGKNHNLKAAARFSPRTSNDKIVGREVISQWLSGWNTMITIATHAGTIPLLPELGKLNISLPIPHFRFGEGNGNGDESEPSFISDATMHLFSSSSEFTLHSPLSSTTMQISWINATAFYKGDEVATIYYDEEFDVPPGQSTSPRLPVGWDLGSVGYEAIRRALGGTLKLNAEAEVEVRIDKWIQNVWYKGKGIGAKVRL